MPLGHPLEGIVESQSQRCSADNAGIKPVSQPITCKGVETRPRCSGGGGRTMATWPVGTGERIRNAARTIGPWRLAVMSLSLVVALGTVRFGWVIPLLADFERQLYDLRATISAPRVPIDPGIALVPYDQRTLMETGFRQSFDRPTLAQALANLDQAGVQAVGIILRFDQPEAEDAQVVAALKRMRVPVFLWFVTAATSHEDSWNDPEVARRGRSRQADFFRRISGPWIHAVSVEIVSGKDNVVRQWPPGEQVLPLLAKAMAGRNTFPATGSIDFALPRSDETFAKYPIDLVANRDNLDWIIPVLRGRYVLIGADIPGVDRVTMPYSRFFGGKTYPVLEVQAQMLRQALDGASMRPLPVIWLWAYAILVVLMAVGAGLADLRFWQAVPLIVVALVIVAVLPLLLIMAGIETLDFPLAGAALGWVVAFTAAAGVSRAVGSEERRFAQSALGRFLPKEVARQIIRDPRRLTLKGEKRVIFALFSDLEGFTRLSHGIEPELTASILNDYLAQLSAVVLAHGGTIDKFVGDAVVAFWGAPIAMPNDAANAAACAWRLWEVGEEYRALVATRDCLTLGRTRIGLHCGEAIVGNFGGDIRIQYTALGDVMNTASRLESANKFTGTNVLISGEVVKQLPDLQVMPLGRVVLSGRPTPVEIFQPVPPDEAALAAQVGALLCRHEAGDSGAVHALEVIAATHNSNFVLLRLADRLRTTEPGEAYVLKGK